MRAIQAGDVNGDGKIDLVAGALASGLWLLEQADGAWKRTLIDAKSSGFEHPLDLADLDGDGHARDLRRLRGSARAASVPLAERRVREDGGGAARRRRHHLEHHARQDVTHFAGRGGSEID